MLGTKNIPCDNNLSLSEDSFTFLHFTVYMDTPVNPGRPRDTFMQTHRLGGKADVPVLKRPQREI